MIMEVVQLVVSITWAWLVAIYKAVVPVSYQWKKDISRDTVVVTGAGSGIGRLMALKFAELGCRMVVIDINEAGNEDTAKQVKAKGVEVNSYTVDCSSREAIYKAAEQIKTDVGRVDILVNNAGIVIGKKFLDCPDHLIEKTMEVNVNAHYWLTKCFLPGMMERNHGHIVSIASAAGLLGCATLVEYCASKHAAVGFNDALRAEMDKFGKHGVQTTVVCPYFINTGMFDGAKTRFPAILDILDPDHVTKKIIEAVQTNQTMLILPKSLYLTHLFKGIFPTSVSDKVETFFGLKECMDDFKGRSKSKAA